MKLVITSTGYGIDKSTVNDTIGVEAESIEAIQNMVHDAAYQALMGDEQSFTLFNTLFYVHNVIPVIRPHLRTRWAMRQPHRAPPREYPGRFGDSHYYKGVKVQSLEDWFAQQVKATSAEQDNEQ